MVAKKNEMVAAKDREASDIAEGEEAEVMHPTPAQEKSLAELLGELTWEEITAEGVISLSEIHAAMIAQGRDPAALDYLYE